MNALLRFITRLDARAARALWVSLLLFATVVGVFLVGRFVLDLEPGSVQAWFETASTQWYALPATIALFTALAFIGAPQFALIAAAVYAFGPVEGFIYSWVATMVSATVDFWLGRYLGADVVRRYGGRTVNNISAFVGRNGFWASLIVRIVPSAPFIVVNMAAGVSRMSYFAFIAGAGVGVIPKTALVAFAGAGLMALFQGAGVWAAVFIALAGAVWLAVMLVARRWLRAQTPEGESGADPLAIEDGAAHKKD
jgi:uncharacterized membrane protein YdjX (TVP38/TMEM64 family)